MESSPPRMHAPRDASGSGAVALTTPSQDDDPRAGHGDSDSTAVMLHDADNHANGGDSASVTPWDQENAANNNWRLSQQELEPDRSFDLEHNEEHFVPLRLASVQVGRVARGMEAMKQRHLEAVEDIDKHYRVLERETNQIVAEFVKDLRTRGNEKIASIKTAHMRYKEKKRAEIKELDEKLRQKDRELFDLQNEMDREIALNKASTDEESTSRKDAVETMSRKNEVLKNDLKQKEDQLLTLLGELEDSEGVRQNLNSSLERSKTDLKTKISEAKQAEKDSSEQVIQKHRDHHKRQFEDSKLLVDKTLADMTKTREMQETQISHANAEIRRLQLQLKQPGSSPVVAQVRSSVVPQPAASSAKTKGSWSVLRTAVKSVGPLQSMLTEQRAQLDSLKKEKKGTKQEIKEFESRFEAENGRPPSKEDKKTQKGLYEQHDRLAKAATQEQQKVDIAQAEIESAELQEAVDSLKGAVQEKNDEITALQQELKTVKERSLLVAAASTGGDDGDGPSTNAIEHVLEELEEKSRKVSEAEDTVRERDAELDRKATELSTVRGERDVLYSEKVDLEEKVELTLRTAGIVKPLRDLELQQAESVEQMIEIRNKQRALKEKIDKQPGSANPKQKKEQTKLKTELEEKEGAVVSLGKNIREIRGDGPDAPGSVLDKLEGAASAGAGGCAAGASTGATSSLQDQKTIRSMETRIAELAEENAKVSRQLEQAAKSVKDAAGASPADGGGKAARGGVSQSKAIMDLEKNVKDKDKEVKRLQQKLESAQSAGGKGQQDAAALHKKDLEDMDKKHKRELETVKKEEGKGVEATMKKLTKAEKDLEKYQADLASASEVAATLEKEVKPLRVLKEKSGKLTETIETLEGEKVGLQQNLKTAEKTAAGAVKEKEELDTLYRQEAVLRKRYYNEIEDMKGKIRVYCRVRPFAGYEVEKNCQSAVNFPDGYTIEVKDTKTKTYNFDSVFAPEIGQQAVFEDTKRLCTSAVDGYNVCIFAYGQTGSGKTWTMMGDTTNPDNYGIIPRSINEVFDLVHSNPMVTYEMSAYMLEIYNDQLLDLLRDASKPPPKLDIKKDAKGIVVVPGSNIRTVKTPKDVLDLLEQGQKLRKTASTKMNAGSSRSHMIFALLLAGTNTQTGVKTLGKLSLVDLAGSERASKTGAAGDQMKEAQAINKSLSALGDVISALSTGENFIPYRNNKLTQMLQDSLGGNAKTLCFVNTSPADYNAEETNNSLTYAARMKLITNDASKASESQEVQRLKKIIKALKSGGSVEEEDLNDE